MENKTRTSVENAITIVNNATKNRLSLSEAARQSNWGRNYVSDVKSRLPENVANKKITKTLYKEFNSALKSYQKVFQK